MYLHKPQHAIILEEASLELIPERFKKHKSCKLVQSRFGTSPEMQILDDNYHNQILAKLPNPEKRGRPDVVHFALLDITSTPAYLENLVGVYIHTIENKTIRVFGGVRLPRTLQRFCGVMGKVLSGKLATKENELFELKNESLQELISHINAERVICLSTEGIPKDILSFVHKPDEVHAKAIWIIGGFSHGHFNEQTKSLASDIISISKYSLPAHVVTARLCFALEQSIS